MHGSKAALMKFLFNFMVQLGKLIKGLYVPKRKKKGNIDEKTFGRHVAKLDMHTKLEKKVKERIGMPGKRG